MLTQTQTFRIVVLQNAEDRSGGAHTRTFASICEVDEQHQCPLNQLAISLESCGSMEIDYDSLYTYGHEVYNSFNDEKRVFDLSWAFLCILSTWDHVIGRSPVNIVAIAYSLSC